MTSPACSGKRVLAHEIRLTLCQFWPLPVLELVYFFLFINLSDIITMVRTIGSPPDETMVGFHMFNQGFTHAIMAGIPLFGFLVALCLFFFLFQPRACDTYFSLGVRRGTLFRIRYFTGAAFLVVPLLLVCLCTLILQRIQIPQFYGIFWRMWIYVTLLLCVGALAVYTLTVLVFTLCGTMLEGALYTLLAAAAPCLVAWAVGSLLYALLPGSPYNAGFAGFLEPPFGSRVIQDGSPISLLVPSRLFSPATFFFHDLFYFQHVYVENGSEDQLRNVSYPSDLNPHWGLLIGWAAFIVGAALLAGFLFRRRKAEMAGFAGSSRIFGIGASVLIALCVFAGLQYLPLAVPLRVFLGLLGFAAALFLIGTLAFRGLRWLKKTWVLLPSASAAMLAAAVILATGGFGYSSRVPAVGSIQQASITYRGDPAWIFPIEAFGALTSSFYAETGPFTTEDNLELVTSLHRELAALPRVQEDETARPAYGDTVMKGPVFVKYTLKNGSTLTRRYESLPVRVMEDFLQLDATLTVPQTLIDRLNRALLEYNLPLIATDPYLQQNVTLELSLEERKELLACLAADLKGLTVEEHYFPQNDAKLLLSVNNRENDLFYSNGLGEEYAPYTLPLTPSFPRTLTFLQQEGRYTVPDVPEIGEVRIYPFNPAFTTAGTVIGQDLFLRATDFEPVPGYAVCGPDGWDKLDMDPIPQELVDDLLPCLRSNYYASREVYFVELTVPNTIPNGEAIGIMGDYNPTLDAETKVIYKYLPADAVPDSLKAYLPD